MAGRGAVPDPNAIRRKDHKDHTPETVLPVVSELRGSNLPEGIPWHPRTVTWWATWRSSALSATFGSTDWEFLLETAFIHTAFWNGNASVAPELRLRVAKFGATPEDRLRLRLAVTSPDAGAAKPESASPAKKAKARNRAGDERRARLSIVPPPA